MKLEEDVLRNDIEKFTDRLNEDFQAGRKNQLPHAKTYLQGLFSSECQKRNIERMNENVPSANYEDQQYFLSESKWDWHGLMRHIARDASEALQDYGLVGCTVDEKAHLKKGKDSAAATRQYAGIAGKVENCQVGVYLSLCADKYTTLSNHRLYLPWEWCKDTERCRKAGIPEEDTVFKTKPQQALEMILEHKADGVHFDYVNGDGLYGNSYELSKGLDAEGIPYVLDIHSNQRIYLDKPTIAVYLRKNRAPGDVLRHACRQIAKI